MWSCWYTGMYRNWWQGNTTEKIVWDIIGDDLEYHIKLYKFSATNNRKLLELEILI